MSRPSKQQIDAAVAAAEYLRDHDRDAHYLAQTLLYLRQRNAALEKVLSAANHYLHSGADQHTHARLIQAVDAARRQTHEDSSSLEPDSAFGLE